MLSNVLFDLDGTLTDPKDGITRCIQFSLDQFDVNVPQADQLTWCIGPPLIESFSNLLNTTDKTILDKALSRYRKRFSETGIFENVIYPGVTPSLRRIKKAGFKVFLATSKPEVFAGQILDHFNLTEFFNAIHGSELNGRLSNKSELVAHILDVENLDPRATLIVGDRVYDIIGGKNNGIMTAAVSYGYGTFEEITSSKPDVIFDSFSDIASFLELQ
ncbi:MAG: HAD hydrolase-like protein [Desulfobacterales bacterium]|nr:HAD hydrolase-like protein [Desulfobacterales bacterium]